MGSQVKYKSFKFKRSLELTFIGLILLTIYTQYNYVRSMN